MYYRRSDVRIQELDGETLVLDDHHGFIHQLNQTASFVWHQCDGTCSTAEIVQRFAREFELDEVAASRDVTNVIEKLRELKLLEE